MSGSAMGNYLGVLRRRGVYVATILPLTLFICVVAAFGIRAQYQASATVMLEPSSVPKDIIETTVLSYADQQIEIVQGRVMTLDSLRQIVQDTDPYPDRVTWSAMDKAQRVLEDTTLEKVDPVTRKPAAESNAFSLHYQNPNPALAVAIDTQLAQLFLSYNRRIRTEAAGEAAGFLQTEAEMLAKQMRQVDEVLAGLKSKYGEALPDFLQRNQGTVEDTQRQLDNLQQQVLVAQEKETVLSVQLNQMSPDLTTQSGDLTDIATVRTKLTEAQQRYTPDHPEVKRLQRALQTLMSQQQHSGATAQGRPAASNNPQYQLTAAELAGARDVLANLRAQAAALRAKLQQYRDWVQRTPAAEKEIAEVLRRHSVLQNAYQSVQDRLQSATLAKTFESEQGGERFTLLRAPTLPRSPAYPNRVGWILLGLFFGVALTGIAVGIAESLDKYVRAGHDLALPQQVPLLASIPFIRNTRDGRRRVIMLSSVLASYSLAALIAGAVILSALHRAPILSRVGAAILPK
jgi:polysaccharide biosynthesis transport protein